MVHRASDRRHRHRQGDVDRPEVTRPDCADSRALTHPIERGGPIVARLPVASTHFIDALAGT
jgi:hypothetical protein